MILCSFVRSYQHFGYLNCLHGTLVIAYKTAGYHTPKAIILISVDVKTSVVVRCRVIVLYLEF
jgi:hypothetical protein